MMLNAYLLKKPHLVAGLTVGLALLTVLGTIGFIIWPNIKTIFTLNQQIMLERESLEMLYQRGQKIRQTTAQYEKIKPTLEQFETMFIKPGDELTFVTTLEQVAKQNSVNQKINLAKTDDKLITNKSLNLQVQAIGQFNNLLNYLKDLEKLDYYLNLETVRFSKPADQPKTSDLLQLNLAGTAFYKL
ncbi:hypothetical protein KKC17_00250 [Patescibacteria group bacterium]|nr:hypothetical protein [Patescibacteria group bacterium]